MPNQITNPTAIRTEAMNFDPKNKSETRLKWTNKQIKYFDVNRRSYRLGWLKKMKANIQSNKRKIKRALFVWNNRVSRNFLKLIY
jgi:hypothetical protein